MKRLLPDIVAIVAFVLISFVYFFPADLEGRILFQHDTSAAVGAGREAQQYKEETGRTTRWTNSIFGGMPTYQMMPSYDSTRPLSVVQRVYRLFLPEYVWLTFVMLLGFYLLLRAFGLPAWLSALGGVAWAFSSYFFILISAGHLWKFITLAYVPPTLAGIVLAYRGRVVWGAVVTALFVALQVASNHVQMSYYFLMVIGLVVVAYGVMALRGGRLREWVRTSAVLLLAAVIGVATNASNLYHTYTYSRETMRGPSELTPEGEAAEQATTSGLDRDYITAWSYGVGETWTLLVPNFEGGSSSNLLTESGTALRAGDMRYAQLYNSFTQYFGEQPWTAGPVYVGAMVLALFVIGCFVVRGPLKWALVAATALSIALSWGKNFMPLTNLFIDYVPMYSKFRAVSSILVVAELTFPLLAMLGLWQVVQRPSVLREPWTAGRGRMPWVVVAGAVAGLLVAWIGYGSTDFVVYIGFALLEVAHFVIVYRLLTLRYGVVIVALLHTALPALAFALWPDWFHSSFITAMEQTALNNAAAQHALPAAELPDIVANISAMRAAIVSADAWRSLGIILIGTLLLLLHVRRADRPVAKADTAHKQQPYLLYALIALCLVDMWTVNKRYLNDNQFVEPITKAQSFVKSNADDFILRDTTLDYRVLNFAASTFDENTTAYWHKSVGGYHAAKLRRYQELIDHHLRPEMEATYRAVLQSGGAMDSIDGGLWRVINMLNARYFIFMGVQGELAVRNPYACGNAWFVDEVEWVDDANEEIDAIGLVRPERTAVVDRRFAAALGAAASCHKDSASTLRLTDYAPDRLVYETDNAGAGVAVFSEIYYPEGWQATIDGTPAPIARANYVLRAMAVPEGHHVIEMTFDPRSLHVTETVAYVAYLLMLVGVAYAVVREWRMRRRAKA